MIERLKYLFGQVHSDDFVSIALPYVFGCCRASVVRVDTYFIIAMQLSSFYKQVDSELLSFVASLGYKRFKVGRQSP